MTSPQTNFHTQQGHSVFRNQPSYKYFDQTFEDNTDDALFRCLNELHPHFLGAAQQKQDAVVFQNTQLLDPRNRQIVRNVFIDHTKNIYPKIFRSPNRSGLTKVQHVMCLKVLLAWQQCEEVQEPDVLVFRQTSRKRRKEQQQFLEFIANYCRTQRERIYAPAQPLVQLYTVWYAYTTAHLMRALKDGKYNTHLGLPHVRLCCNNTQEAFMDDVVLRGRNGYVPLLQTDEDWQLDWQHLQRLLQKYAEIQMNTLEQSERFHRDFVESLQQEAEVVESAAQFQLPLESLLFLLTAGDYLDLPSEMLLDIVTTEDNRKTIVCQQPLPARSCGWHTHQLMVQQAYEGYRAICPSTKWLLFENEKVKQQSTAADVSEEIDASCSSATSYKPLLYEEYLQKLPDTLQPQVPQKIKHNCAAVQWSLKATNGSNSLQIQTTLQQPPARNENAQVPQDFIGGCSIKLEYKSQFGCEVMSKQELLREWLSLSLLGAEHAQQHRLRIAVDTFALQLHEQLSRAQIEQQLRELYAVQMPRLLGGLLQFLQLLQEIPAGHYMLRYNAKFPDKLLLCAPAKEINARTVVLHELLQQQPSDLAFMTQQQMLHIDDKLCSVLHQRHKVLPCAFLPLLIKDGATEATRAKSWLPPPEQQQEHKVLNDRDNILAKVQRRADAAQAQSNLLRKRSKLQQKRRRRHRLTTEKVALRQQQQEEEMFLGFA